jgi:hypothetical protein
MPLLTRLMILAAALLRIADLAGSQTGYDLELLRLIITTLSAVAALKSTRRRSRRSRSVANKKDAALRMYPAKR